MTPSPDPGFKKTYCYGKAHNVYCFIDYAKAFDCVDHNKLWEILQEMEIPEHLICFLRNLHVDQEAKLEPDMEKQTASK